MADAKKKTDETADQKKAEAKKNKAEAKQRRREQGLGRPSTSSALWAEWRRGLKDLQDFVLTPFPDSHKSRYEPGGIATPKQLEVYKSKHQKEPNQEFGKKAEPEKAQPEPVETTDEVKTQDAGNVHGTDPKQTTDEKKSQDAGNVHGTS